MNIRELIRGTKYPMFTEHDEWEQIKSQAKSNHPIRYWIAEDLWDFSENVITYPLRKYQDVRAYFRNRFGTKTHILQTNLPKGKWCEYQDRLLHGMMDSFCIWLREEMAENCADWDGLNFTGKVNHDVILEALKERIEISTGCGITGGVWAEYYKEMREIYLWWQNFENIPDTFDESGMSSFYAQREEKGIELLTPLKDDEREEWRALSEINQRMEKEHEEEIQNYMIRLVKIRQSLWC